MISYNSVFGRALRFDCIDPGDALINRGQRRELQAPLGLLPVTTRVEVVRAVVRVSIFHTTIFDVNRRMRNRTSGGVGGR